MNAKQSRLAVLLAVACLLLGPLLLTNLPQGGAVAQQLDPEQALQRAWRNASASGAYHFTTQVQQIQHPGPSLANVGRSSTRDTLYLEGETDLGDQTLHMSLWNEANGMGPDDALQVLVEDGRAYGRCATCEWEPIEDVYGPVLPGADLLGYLAGARNVQAGGSEEALGITYQRYTFEVDGPAFGYYLSQQMESYLRERGELPPGVSLNMVDVYQRTEGSGTLWVGPQGLPRKLAVHLLVPAGDAGDWVEADIASDFGRYDMAWAAAPTFGQNPLAWSASQLSALARHADGFAGLALRTMALLAVVVAMALVVRFGYLRRVYAALVVGIIACMVVTPLLQSHQVYAYGQLQAERQQRQADEQTQRQALASVQQSVAPAWDPHRDPLASQASQDVLASAPVAPMAPLSRGAAVLSLGSGSVDGASDDDGDGLTFDQERFLGTDPTSVDTDGDGITDDVEVEGFVDAQGTRWYLNPFDGDSNHDGLPDAQECPECLQSADDPLSPRGTCADTDGDLIPDVYDDDNDGDGVEDRVDLAPFAAFGSAAVPFDRDRPFNLVVDQLEPNRTVFVDLQIRPKNPEHLAYRHNVLDWPTDDTAGQIQRVLDTTFADQPNASAVNAANGDMRLIPMLEITIPHQDAHQGNLPLLPGAAPITATTPIGQWVDLGKLDPYGISVSYKNDRGDLLMLVPLNLVSDATGGGKAAFSAHVPYFPSSDSWGAAHQMRVLWLLQMVSDVCDTAGFTASSEAQNDDALYATELETYCSRTNHRREVVSVVHAYDEEWVLAGLAVREDHGMRLAVALEDPDTDPRLDYDDQLWNLAFGLGESFMAGRANDNGQLDLNVADIKARWDNQSNGGVADGDEILWGIPKNALRVATFDLDSSDDLVQIPMTITPQLLDQHFRVGGGVVHSSPMLLFARQEIYRNASLGMDSSIVQMTRSAGESADDGLRVVMDSVHVPELVLNALQWQTYRSAGSDWEVYDVADLYDPLWLQLKDALAQQAYDPDDLDIDDQADLAMSFYLSLYHGAAALVQRGAVAYETPAAAPDSSLGPKVGNPWIDIYKKVVMKVLEPVLKWARYMESLQDLYTPSRGKLDSIKLLYQRYKYGVKTAGSTASKVRVGVAVGILIGGAVLAIGLTVAAAALGVKPIQYVANVMSVLLAAYALITTVQAIRKATQGISGFVNQMNAVGKSMSSASMKAGIVGLVISIVMQWGMLVASVLMAGVSITSLAFTSLLAETLANSVASIILFVIACIPIVGQIIVAILGLIDAMIQAVCAFIPDDDKEDDIVAGICKGITGWFTELIKWTIYGQTVMVDLEADDRLSIWGLDQRFVDPRLGVSDGNSMAYAANITTTVRLVDVPADWKAQAYWWQYDYDALESSAYIYDFSQVEPEEKDDKLHVIEDLSRGDEMGWTQIDQDTAQIERNIAISAVPLPEVGINKAVSLYIAEGFAVPTQECWAAPPPPPYPPYPLFPICYIRTFEDTTYIDLSQSFRFDVFPATLDEFYVLSQCDPADKHKGYALGWDDQFERMADADGDGLRNRADGGADPNDSMWDTDGDGLGDDFELAQGLNPESADADGDGLTDGQELRYGTDPYRRDTDGDGLADGEEFWHQREDGVWDGGWEIVYGFQADGTPRRTWVNADPLFVDGDADVLSDYEERLYAYSPYARNSDSVLTLDSQIAEVGSDGSRDLTDGYVAPGQTLHYTATVGNGLMAVSARGLLESDSCPDGIDTDALAPITYDLKPQRSITLTGQIGVENGAVSGKRFVTQVAGALLVNERAEANFAEVLLHLDEAAPDAGFADASGVPYHNAVCATGNCPTTQRPGVYGSGVAFDGNDVLDLGAFDIQGQVSISAWVKPDNIGAERTIVSHGPDARGRQVFLRLIDGKYMVGSVGNAGLHDASANIPAGDMGQWVHLAGVYDGARWRLYRNGMLLQAQASRVGALRVNANWSVGARPDGSAALYGTLDEVAIYATALSASEVQRLFSRPVVHLALDEGSNASIYSDSSGLGNVAIAWPIAHRKPTSGKNGILRKAVSFDGGDCLLMNNSASLEITEPRFTLAAWLKPQDLEVPRYDNYVQGVIGQNSDTDAAYPTLQIAGSRLRAGFSAQIGGSGSFRWYQYTTSNSWLTRGNWNHVVVTFDGVRFRFYVDGKLCENEPGVPQDADGHAFVYDANTRLYRNASFMIGRTSNVASVYFDRMVMDEEHDAGSRAEPYLLWNNVETGWSTNLADGEEAQIDLWKEFSEEGTAKLMESDPYNQEDTCGTHTYRTDTPAPANHEVELVLSGGLDGTLYTKYYNSSIPFRGLIDEVMVYKRALEVHGAVNEVEDLYNAATIAMRLRLDEPPGANVFRDWTGQHHGSVPAGSAEQPTTGVAGRVNQATWFEGDDQIHVDSLSLPKRYTLAAWVRGSRNNWSPAGSAIMNAGDREPSLSVNGSGELQATIGGTAISGGLVPARTWTHVAYVWDGDRAKLYVNGQLVRNAAVSGASGDGLSIGAGGAGEPWRGELDDVIVYKRALSSEAMLELYQSAPHMMLHCDDDAPLQDASGNNFSGSCDAACPAVGEMGRIDGALTLSGVDQYVELPTANTLGLQDQDFTVSAWVKAQELASSGTHLVLGHAAGVSGGLSLGIVDAKPYFGAYGLDLAGETALQPNLWYHMAWVVNNGVGTMLLNGSVVAESTFSYAYARGTQPLYLGGSPSGQCLHGMLDEVALYRRALSARELNEIYNYQASWVQDRAIHEIIVDAEAPTTSLLSDASYFPLSDPVMAIRAHDATSCVTAVEWRINGGAWEQVPNCTDAVEGIMYCPTFNPGGEGAYLIETRATDLVGNRQNPSANTIFVDDTAPVPLSGIADNALLPAPLHSSQSWHRVVHLQGTVSDPALVDANPGSGVASLDVTVRRDDGARIGDLWQAAKLTPQGGNVWSWDIDYAFGLLDATGDYTVEVRTRDAVGNSSTVTDLVAVRIDTTAPTVKLIDPSSGASDQGAITETATIIVGEIDDAYDEYGKAVYSSGISDVEVAYDQTTDGNIFSAEPANIAFGFEQEWLFDGMGVVHGVLRSGDDLNHGTRGQVGNYALWLDGVDDWVETTQSIDLRDTSFTVAFWAKPETPGVVLTLGDGLVIGTAPAGGYVFGLDGGCNAQLSMLLSEGETLEDLGDGWVQYAYVYDQVAGQKRVYWRGYGSTLWSMVQANAPAPLTQSGALAIGQAPGGCSRYAGALDDLRIYDRALTAQELSAVDRGWWPVDTLTPAPDGKHGTWSTAVPQGLEGFYAIRLRGGDNFENVSRQGDAQGTWHGMIDNAAPRLQLERQYLGEGDDAKTRYLGYVEDLNLVDENLACPCGIDTVTYEQYNAPWYTDVYTGSAPRLYRLSFDCEEAGHQFGGVVMRGQDVFGHQAQEIRGGLRSAAIYTASQQVLDLDVTAQVAYLALNGQGLETVDVSQPTTPVHLGNSQVPLYGRNQTDYAADMGSGATSPIVFAADGPAAMTTVDCITVTYTVETGNYGSDYLRVWLVSPRNNRYQLYTWASAQHRTIQETRVLHQFDGEPAYGTWRLHMVDPNIGEADIRDWEVTVATRPVLQNDLVAEGDAVYAADDAGALRVWDVSDPTQPRTSGYALDGQGGASSGVDYARHVDITDDGRFTAFSSDASNLAPDDTNGQMDIFVHDSQTGSLERVSVASDGTQGDAYSRFPRISEDGRWVVFESLASTLVSGDSAYTDIFVHDRQTHATRRLSVAANGNAANQNSDSPVISADGRYVAYHSYASNLATGDTNSQGDVLVHDRDLDENGVFDETGTGKTKTVVISRHTDGTQGNGDSRQPAISRDGKYIAFTSSAGNLIDSDPALCGTYPYRQCRDTFIRNRDVDGNGIMDEAGQVWTKLVSKDSSGNAAQGDTFWPDVSDDGRYVSFASDAADLVPNDTNAQTDVFVRDLSNNTTRRASMTNRGLQATGGGSFGAAISGDGMYVAYQSFATNLAPNDNNGTADVFVWHADPEHYTIFALEPTTELVSGNAQGAPSSGSALRPAISSDGRYLAYAASGSDLPGAAGSVRQVYRYDRQGTTEIVSRVPVSATSVAVDGDWAFLGTASTLEAYLVSDPSVPTQKARLDLGVTVRDMAVSGQYLYVVGYADANEDGLRVYQIGHPNATSITLTLVAWHLGADKRYAEVLIVDDVCYVGGKDTTTGESLLAYDATAPAGALTPLGAGYTSLANASGLDDMGQALMVGLANDVTVVDVSDAAQPAPYGAVATQGTVRDLRTQDGYVHVANGDLEVLAPVLLPGEEPVLATIILSPAHESVLTAYAATEINGYAYAEGGWLQDLQVGIEGTTYYDARDWAGQSITSTRWSAPSWTPDVDGVFAIRAMTQDTQGGALNDTITVTVDTEAPIVGATTTVFTTTHYQAELGQVTLSGVAADSAGVGYLGCEVSLDGEALTCQTQGAVSADDTLGQWLAYWLIDGANPPDGTGSARMLSVRVTDRAGHTDSSSQAITVDVVPPIRVTMSMDADGVPLLEGQVVAQIGTDLTLTWSPSSDAAGLGATPYWVRWYDTQAGLVRSEIHGALDRSSSYSAIDGQRMHAELITTDVNGNQTVLTWGPVYVEAPTTPDYVALNTLPDYRGWMDTGCSLIGNDRRVAAKAQSQAALDQLQRLYASWDAASLRLTWTGANWDTDGDLFIYLDTVQPGEGSGRAYNPHLGDPRQVYLPGASPDSAAIVSQGKRLALAGLASNRVASRSLLADAPMMADYGIWVQDTATAWLLEWQSNAAGGAWQPVRTLSPAEFRFDAASNHGQTDLLLRKADLDLDSGGPLDLVAFASEQDALKVWASMPAANPLSSDLAAASSPNAGKPGAYSLTQRYHWDGLDLGLCPNGTLPALTSGVSLKANQNIYADSDLTLSLTATPDGSVYAYVRDSLFWLWSDLFGSERPVDLSLGFQHMDGGHAPQGDGDTIDYVLSVTNQGDAPATGVRVDLTSHYALRLVDGGQTTSMQVDLGTVAPGQTVSATVTGIVNLSAAMATDYASCLVQHPDDPALCQKYLHWAALDATFYDSAHGSEPLDWFWSDHPVDPQAPAFCGILSPNYAISQGENLLEGYAFDDSQVARIDIEFVAPSGATKMVQCTDCMTSGGRWAYPWNVMQGTAGLYNVRVRAVDEYDQLGPWSVWYAFQVDTTAPTVTLSDALQAYVQGHLLQAGPAILSGSLADDQDAQSVAVCYAGDCQPAQVELTLGAGVSVEASGPVAITSCPTCVEIPLVVDGAFEVGVIALGFGATHPYRDDLQVDLVAPSGVTVRVIEGERSILGTFQHYDVMLSDAAEEPLHAFRGDDDPAAPYFDRACRPYQPLNAMVGQPAQGTWRLRICDSDGSEHNGYWDRVRLELTPRDAGAKRGSWRYSIPVGVAGGEGQHVWEIRAYDGAGNTSLAKTLSYTVDRQAPSLTYQLTGLISSGDVAAVLTGTVMDVSGLNGMYLVIQEPDGRSYAGQPTWLGESPASSARQGVELAASVPWGYSLSPNGAGEYKLWIMASDGAGNQSSAGPLIVVVQDAGPQPTPPPVETATPTPGPLQAALSTELDDTFCPGWTLRYTLNMRNTDVSSVTGVEITSTLPSNTCCAEMDAGNPVPCIISADGTFLKWHVPNLAPGQSITLRMSLHSFTSIAVEEELRHVLYIQADQLAGTLRAEAWLEADPSLCGLAPTMTPMPTPTASTLRLPLVLKQSRGSTLSNAELSFAPTATVPVMEATPRPRRQISIR